MWKQKMEQKDPSHLREMPLLTQGGMLPYWVEEHKMDHWSRD